MPTSTHSTYERWLAQVEAAIYRIAGVGIDDIGDADYRISFDAGVTPSEMAREALEASDFPFDE